MDTPSRCGGCPSLVSTREAMSRPASVSAIAALYRARPASSRPTQVREAAICREASPAAWWVSMTMGRSPDSIRCCARVTASATCSGLYHLRFADTPGASATPPTVAITLATDRLLSGCGRSVVADGETGPGRDVDNGDPGACGHIDGDLGTHGGAAEDDRQDRAGAGVVVVDRGVV